MATAYKRKGSPHWWISHYEDKVQQRYSTGIAHNGNGTIPVPVRRILARIEERDALNKFGVPIAWEPVSVEDAFKAQKAILNSRAAGEDISDDHAMRMCEMLDLYLPHLQAVGINMLNDLTPDLARAYMSRRLKSIKPTTFKPEKGRIAAVWQRYMDEEKAPLENHWSKLKVGGEFAKKRSLTQEELNLLSCILPDAPIEMQYLTRMGFYMGCRMKMAATLNIDQVDFDERLIRFGKVKRKKHTQSLHDSLYTYLIDYPLLPGGWFVDQSVANWSAHYCFWMDKVREQTGLFKDITHHCLRVTFNTMMLESDLPEQVTMDIIGHSSTEAHQRYKDIKAARFQSTINETIRGL